MKPGLLFALGAAVAAGIALTSGESKAAPPKQGPTGPVPSGPGCIDPGMPPALKAQVEKALSDTKLSPADFETLSGVAKKAGYPLAAACLEKKARDRRAELEADMIARGGMPFIIRMGDIPYFLATYYTGVGGRFKELGALNPKLGSLKTVKGVTNYPGWIPGTEILIPVSWNPLDKPLPAPLTGKGKAPEPPAEAKPWGVSEAQSVVEDAAGAAKAALDAALSDDDGAIASSGPTMSTEDGGVA